MFGSSQGITNGNDRCLDANGEDITKIIENWEKVSSSTAKENFDRDCEGLDSQQEDIHLSESGEIHLLEAPNWRQADINSLEMASHTGITFNGYKCTEAKLRNILSQMDVGYNYSEAKLKIIHEAVIKDLESKGNSTQSKGNVNQEATMGKEVIESEGYQMSHEV